MAESEADSLRRQLREKEAQLEVEELKRQLYEKQALLDHLSASTTAMVPYEAVPGAMAEQLPPQQLDDEQQVLVQLITFLGSPIEEEMQDSLYTLSEMVSYAYGQDGARLGEIMRDHGGLMQLTKILSDRTQPLDIHQQVLLLLGNLCSDSVDSASMQSKRYLLRTGVEGALFECLQSDDPYVLMFTCGAVQNLCHDAEWSARAVAYGADRTLSELLAHGDEKVVKYAAGALKNIASTTKTVLTSEARGHIDQRARQVRFAPCTHGPPHARMARPLPRAHQRAHRPSHRPPRPQHPLHPSPQHRPSPSASP